MKIWAYGDSFTAGDGTIITYDWQCPNPGKKKFWLDYITDYYKVDEVVNKGIGGLSNNLIYLRLLSDLKNFKQGDLVIVGQTYGEREEFWADNVYEKDFDNEDHNAWWLSKVQPVGSPSDNIQYESVVNKVEFNKEIKPRQPQDLFASLLNHIGNTKIPLVSYYESYYKLKFKYLLDHLETLGINTFLWEVPQQAQRFQTIWAATNGKIDDGHWSWKGSEMFGRWLTKQIKIK